MEQWYDGARYSRRFIFRFGDCDSKARASLYSIMKIFSEIAGEDYAGKGFGRDLLLEREQVFLLSRFSIRFHRRPVFDEKTVVTAWAREIKGPLFCRDYEIKAEDGELLVSGSSAWLMANPNTREILRPSKFGDLPEMEPTRSDCEECKKLKRNTQLPDAGTRPVFYSDLDSNGHVNNSVYGRIALDFLPAEYQDKDIKDFFINYNMETKRGETLYIMAGGDPYCYEVQGYVGDEIHFSAEIAFID